MASEEEVGITEHVNATPGFSAVLKHRYRDFQVREVDLSGRLARLTTLELPSPVVVKVNRITDGTLLQEKVPEVQAAFAAIAGEESAELLAGLLRDIAGHLRSSPSLNTQSNAAAMLTTEASMPPSHNATHTVAPTEALPATLVVSEGGETSATGSAPDAPPAKRARLQETCSTATFSADQTPVTAVVPRITHPACTLSKQHTAAADRQRPLSVLLPAYESKHQRRLVHEFFKTNPNLPPLLAETEEHRKGLGQAHAGGNGSTAGAVTSTAASTAAEPKPQIRVFYADNVTGRTEGSGGRRDSRGGRGSRQAGRSGGCSNWGGNGGEGWPGGPQAPYVRFVVWKENLDTQGALANITRTLRLQHSALGFAGTKDKRGVTTQFVTAFKVAPARLAGLSRSLRGMRIGNFEFVEGPLRLGQLSGNQFELVMRNVTAEDPAQIEAACNSLRTTGFINYFGLQRFGNGRVRTDEVGKALLRGEWRAAVAMVMTGKKDEREDCAAARKLYLVNGDAKAALRALPRWLELERCVLEVLVREGANCYVNAIMALPRTMRTMYLHAYQSYLWNMAASHRVRTYGVEGAVAGDLVLLPQGASAGGEGVTCTPSDATDAAAMVVDAIEDAAVLVAAADKGGEVEATAGPNGGSAERLAAVHVVTAEEAASRRFTVHDVVLPVPGCSVMYPHHATAGVYKELLAKDGISLDVPAHSTAELSLRHIKGDYRPILHLPKDLTYRLVQYSHPDDDSLSVTDVELLEQQQHGTAAHRSLPLPPPLPLALDAGTTQAPAPAATLAPAAAAAAGALLSPAGTSRAATLLATAPAEACCVGESAGTPAAGAAAAPEAAKTTSAQSHERIAPESGAVHSAPGTITAEGDEAGPPAAGKGAGLVTPAPAPAGQAPCHHGLSASGALTALQLSFQLPPSCYATMLIRELTKQSTSARYQKGLSAQGPAD